MTTFHKEAQSRLQPQVSALESGEPGGNRTRDHRIKGAYSPSTVTHSVPEMSVPRVWPGHGMYRLSRLSCQPEEQLPALEAILSDDPGTFPYYHKLIRRNRPDLFLASARPANFQIG